MKKIQLPSGFISLKQTPWSAAVKGVSHGQYGHMSLEQRY